MIVWFSGLARAAPVNCPAAIEKAEIEALLSEAEGAIGALDETSLARAVERARGLVLCIDSELSPVEIARLYRLSGISRYVGGDLVLSVTDFSIARALDPDGAIDPQLGRPLRMTYEAVPPSSGETRPLPPPSEGWLDVDGARSTIAPADRGFFLQWVGADGGMRGTWLVSQGDPIPYPVKRAGQAGEDARRGPGRALLVSGLASTAVAAGAMAGAAVLEDRFARSDRPSSEQGALISANRVLGFGGIGLGFAGLGLVSASLVVGL